MVQQKKMVEGCLIQIRQAIEEKRYQIASRQKNQQLFEKYLLTENDAKELLMELQVSDYVSSVRNAHARYPREILHIFGKKRKILFRYENREQEVELYIKLNILKGGYCIVVSFHEKEQMLFYPYGQEKGDTEYEA